MALTLAMSAPAPALTVPRSNVTRPSWQLEGVWFQFAFFAIALLIVCSRRPDALLNPQFYAEDGVVFFSDAYSHGLHSLLSPHGGYFQALPRLIALLAQLVPFFLAPLILNLAAIVIQILPANVFLSSRFSNIKLAIRLLGAFVYLALPNSFEIHATLTNVQSHLILLACLLLLAMPGKARVWQVFDGAILVLTSLSGPTGILLLPFAALMWWKKAHASSAWSFALLLPPCIAQTICVLTHWHSRVAPQSGLAGQPFLGGESLGTHLLYLNAIIGRQVCYSSLLGLNAQKWVIDSNAAPIAELAFTMLGLGVLVYALRHAPLELKFFILFAAATLACALVNPLAGPADRPQWYWLSLPGIGNRYYFLPMLALLASLFWLATTKTSAGLRWCAVALLVLLPVGICKDWEYPAFFDFRFGESARAFHNAPSGTRFTFPINPGWSMTLTKR